ncbi:hypothetical protein [Methanolobus sp. WCC5]|uniref:hypothetical protein n=1 Tax=Methanolobus sp. WCC5 TaxID=3125785 RepID=UPI003253FA53
MKVSMEQFTCEAYSKDYEKLDDILHKITFKGKERSPGYVLVRKVPGIMDFGPGCETRL